MYKEWVRGAEQTNRKKKKEETTERRHIITRGRLYIREIHCTENVAGTSSILLLCWKWLKHTCGSTRAEGSPEPLSGRPTSLSSLCHSSGTFASSPEIGRFPPSRFGLFGEGGGRRQRGKMRMGQRCACVCMRNVTRSVLHTHAHTRAQTASRCTHLMLMRYCANATASGFPVMVMVRSVAPPSLSSQLLILIMAPEI